jgi:hypothetical protein
MSCGSQHLAHEVGLAAVIVEYGYSHGVGSAKNIDENM